MNKGDLRRALHDGTMVYGTRIVSPSPVWPQAVAETGIDFVFLDLEHIPLERDRLSWMCHMYGALGIAPLVRISRPDPYMATTVLDGGAAGIIAPYVETVAQARALRGAVKLRPLKGEKLNVLLEEDRVLPESTRNYLAERNTDSILILNIESEPALEGLDQLLAVPGLDALLVGPHDLALNLGIPDQYDHPRFRQAVAHIIRSARQHQIGVGVHFFAVAEKQIAWAKEGANLVIHGTDMELFQRALGHDIGLIRKALGEAE